MTEREFRQIYQTLIEENPVAVRAVLKILDVVFTDRIPTLAVTLGDRPILLVNLAFVTKHCATDLEVAAVIVHELLHVVLRHTQRFTPITHAEHIAFDAVINAIIHRTMGSGASAMMARYYAKARGANRLLRPPRATKMTSVVGRIRFHASPKWRDELGRFTQGEDRFKAIWALLYEGRVLADEIRDFVADLPGEPGPAPLLGNHAEPAILGGATIPGEPSGRARALLVDALDRDLSTMPPNVIGRTPLSGRLPGAGGAKEQLERQIAAEARRRWLRDTYAVLSRHLIPKGGAPRSSAAVTLLPILSPRNPRATLRALWNPILPEAQWPSERRERSDAALVYLDASGSMYEELPLLALLLTRLAPYVRKPFWGFSTVVSPATIANGQLRTESTGGTHFGCVLEHLATHRPRAAVAITDGYVERLDLSQVARTRATRLHVLVTHNGSTAPFDEAGIAVTQLGKVPT